MVSVLLTDQHSQTPMSKAEPQPSPCRIPLTIHLGDRLTDPAEAACAEVVASWLSAQVGRTVELAELEGLLLYLWSEEDVEGRVLDDYLDGGSLEATLLKTGQLENAELLPFIGKQFWLVSGALIERSLNCP